MPAEPLNLPPDVARAFAEDMRAYFKETNGIKRDEIAARQAWLLERYVRGKLRTNDVKMLFGARFDPLSAPKVDPRQPRKPLNHHRIVHHLGGQCWKPIGVKVRRLITSVARAGQEVQALEARPTRS
jgi:hypothetical protein